jgi:hypothetical protein
LNPWRCTNICCLVGKKKEVGVWYFFKVDVFSVTVNVAR